MKHLVRVLLLGALLWLLVGQAMASPCRDEGCGMTVVYLPIVQGKPLVMSSISGQVPTATPAVAPTVVSR